MKFKFTFVNSPKPPGQCVSLFQGSVGYGRSMFLSPCRQIFNFCFIQHGICDSNLIYNENQFQFHIWCYYLTIFFNVYSRYEQRWGYHLQNVCANSINRMDFLKFFDKNLETARKRTRKSKYQSTIKTFWQMKRNSFENHL